MRLVLSVTIPEHVQTRCVLTLAIPQSDLAVNAELYPQPEEIILSRPLNKYHFVGYGPHQALGSPLSRFVLVEMLRAVARLKNLRPAPGPRGRLRVVEDEDGLGNERYLDTLQRQYGPFPSSLTVLYDT